MIGEMKVEQQVRQYFEIHNAVFSKIEDCRMMMKREIKKDYFGICDVANFTYFRFRKERILGGNGKLTGQSENASDECKCNWCTRKQKMYGDCNMNMFYFEYYGTDVYKAALDEESDHYPIKDYLKFEILNAQKIRECVVGLIVLIHKEFQFKSDTLFIAIYIFDKYCGIRQIWSNRMELVGIAALLIASKYNDNFDLNLTFVQLKFGILLSTQDIVEIEKSILNKLKFKIPLVSAYNFLEYFCAITEETKEVFYLSQYILELALCNFKMIKYKPSVITAAAFFISRNIKNREKPWPRLVKRKFRLNRCRVIKCSKKIIVFLKSKKIRNMKPVIYKFKQSKYCKITDINFHSLSSEYLKI